jgi:hypothetical protein
MYLTLRRISPYVIAGLVLAACSDPSGPEQDDLPLLTVNASANWVYVDLAPASAQQISVTNPQTSTAWDVALFGTSIMLNGGAAGPGGVVGYCICTNAAKTDAEIKTLTADNQRAYFESVSAAQIPTAASAWQSDALVPALNGWYSYNPMTHAVSADPSKAFYVRMSDGLSFAKLHVTKIENPTQTSAGTVTFEYAVQASKGAPLGALKTAQVSVPATGQVQFDLNTGTQTSVNWDIAFEGYNIRVNGGASGSGQAGAIPAGMSFSAITDPSEAPSTVYKADAFGGVFDAKAWYRYNITGTDHQIWPTFDVYLIKRGTEVYKVQLTNYYSTNGDARHITFRYALLAN